jgi:NTE family protein
VLIALGAAFWLLCAGAAAAPTAVEAAPAAARPKIGLVLSGGGARGMAHIGVLQVLEELRVPVDIVVGASFGAIVGGAYAGGADPAELEQQVLATDWSAALQDRLPRDELSYRRREDDTLLSSRLEFGVGRDGLALPRSAFTSAEVERLLRLLAPNAVLTKVEDLPLTYRAVATDMLTGEKVVPLGVPLFTAMRASMSVPGIFAPVTVDGRILGDGGLVSNLPVQLARELGAEVIIAVNLGTPLSGPESIATALGMAQQMINILTEQNVQQSLRELRPQDVLIVPNLSGQDALDFSQIPRSIAAGVAAARAQAERLQALAVDSTAYLAYRTQRAQTHLALAQAAPTVAAVRVEAVAPDGGRVPLPHDPALKPGDALTPAALNAAAAHLQREVDAERVDIVVTGAGARREVVLLPIASPLGLSRFRLGLELESDFEGTNNFTLSGLYTRRGLNDWGAEWRTLARVGAVGAVQTEWYQPLGLASPWFVNARLDYRTNEVTVYEQFAPLAVFRVRSASGSVGVGRRIGEVGQLRVGAQYRWGQLQLALPDLGDPESYSAPSAFYELTFDTLDSLGYPSRGYLLSASGEYFGHVDDPQIASYSSRYDALHAFTSGAWSGHLYAAGVRSAETVVQSLALGGFLRLSGAPLDSIVGDQVLLGRAVLARTVGNLPALAGGAMRLGMSVEWGRATGSASVPDGSTYYGGSIFAEAETRFGPIYLAVGNTHGVGTAIYLFLGSVLLPTGLVR